MPSEEAKRIKELEEVLLTLGNIIFDHEINTDKEVTVEHLVALGKIIKQALAKINT